MKKPFMVEPRPPKNPVLLTFGGETKTQELSESSQSLSEASPKEKNIKKEQTVIKKQASSKQIRKKRGKRRKSDLGNRPERVEIDEPTSTKILQWNFSTGRYNQSFKCKECGRVLPKRYNLRDHQLAHAGTKEF